MRVRRGHLMGNRQTPQSNKRTKTVSRLELAATTKATTVKKNCSEYRLEPRAQLLQRFKKPTCTAETIWVLHDWFAIRILSDSGTWQKKNKQGG